jgi:hypothetical protein
MPRLLASALLVAALSAPQAASAQAPPPETDWEVSRSGTWCAVGTISPVCFQGSWFFSRDWLGTTYLYDFGYTGTWSGLNVNGWEGRWLFPFREGTTESAFASLGFDGDGFVEKKRSDEGDFRRDTEYVPSDSDGAFQVFTGSAFISCGFGDNPDCDYTEAVTVPEPGTLALLAGGLLGLFGVALRRRSSLGRAA